MSVSTNTDSKTSEEPLSRLWPDLSKSVGNYAMEQYAADLQRVNDLHDLMPQKEERWAIEIEKLNRKYMESSKIFNIMEIDAANLIGAARGVGIAFGSAFENAVLKGKGFNNVIQELGKELQRTLFHNLITNPLRNFLKDSVNKGLNTLFGSGEGASGGNIFVNAMEGIQSWFGDTAPQADGKYKSPSVGKLGLNSFSTGGAVNPSEYPGADGSNAISYNTIHMTVNTPDAHSFRANQGEILAELNRAMHRGRRNM